MGSKQQGLLKQAVNWHIKGIELAEKTSYVSYYFMHVNNLAQTYIQLKEYDDAIDLLSECLTHTDYEELQVSTHVNLANVYGFQKKYAKAIHHYQKGIQLSLKSNNHKGIIISYLDLGDTYLTIKDYDNALLYIEKAIKLARTHNYKHFEIRGIASKGEILNALGFYKEAIFNWQRVSLYYTEQKNFSYLLKTYENIQEAFLNLNDYKKAHAYLDKAYHLNDSIQSLQRNEKIEALEVKYQTLRKEKKIISLQSIQKEKVLALKNQQEAFKNLQLLNALDQERKNNKILSLENQTTKKATQIKLLEKDQKLKNLAIEKQKEIKRYSWIGFILILIPVLLSIYILFKKNKAQKLVHQKQEIINSQQVEVLIKENELNMISTSNKAQKIERERIAQDLHDMIGGNLAAIKLQMNSIENWKEVQSKLDLTYQQVRDISHSLMKDSFAKTSFSKSIQQYLNTINQASELCCELHIYPISKVDFLEYNLLSETYKIILELINNTLKHAKAENLEINITLDANELNLIIEDDGIGFNSDESFSGIGLLSLQKKNQTTFRGNAYRLENQSRKYFLYSYPY